MQTVETLIILRRLLWVCTVCQLSWWWSQLKWIKKTRVLVHRRIKYCYSYHRCVAGRPCGSAAQLDRVLVRYARGPGFESRSGHVLFPPLWHLVAQLAGSLQSHGVLRADSHHSYLCVYLYAHYFLIRRNAAFLRWTECEAAEFCMAFLFR